MPISQGTVKALWKACFSLSESHLKRVDELIELFLSIYDLDLDIDEKESLLKQLAQFIAHHKEQAKKNEEIGNKCLEINDLYRKKANYEEKICESKKEFEKLSLKKQKDSKVRSLYARIEKQYLISICDIKMKIEMEASLLRKMSV